MLVYESLGQLPCIVQSLLRTDYRQNFNVKPLHQPLKISRDLGFQKISLIP